MSDIEQSGQDRLRYKIRRLFSGEGVPIDSGVTQLVGDIYIDEDSGSHYEWSGTAWTLKFTVGGGGGLSQEQIATAFNLTPGVKTYRALLTQTGTDAPVATVLENSLGGTVVWTRTNSGQYSATLVGAFPSAKVFPRLSLTAPAGETFYAAQAIQRFSDDVVKIRTSFDGADSVDDALFDTPIEILVYP